MTGHVAIVVFPGSNCEQDCARAFRAVGSTTGLVWHYREAVPDADVVVLPRGFAHGDYLRTGALARLSPVMAAVRARAAEGGPVLGICNGFQILCEAGMLPGALRKNAGLRFMCRWVDVRVEVGTTRFTAGLERGRVLRMPINHFEGNWYCPPHELEGLRADERIVLRYACNPNGSVDDVAGVVDETGTVFGLMPHPERACDDLLGSSDGAALLTSVLETASRVS